MNCALDRDGTAPTDRWPRSPTADLSTWPEGARVIVLRERPHAGAQLTFTDGYRLQAVLTDQGDDDIAVIERHHRQRAHVEYRIRDDRTPGWSGCRSREFQLKEVRVEIVMLAHDLILWTQALLLSGELAKAEPKRLRYRSCTWPVAWRSPDAAPGRTCSGPGPRRANSPPPLSASKRSELPWVRVHNTTTVFNQRSTGRFDAKPPTPRHTRLTIKLSPQHSVAVT